MEIPKEFVRHLEARDGAKDLAKLLPQRYTLKQVAEPSNAQCI